MVSDDGRGSLSPLDRLHHGKWKGGRRLHQCENCGLCSATQIHNCHRITFISLKYLVRLSGHLFLISQFVSKQKDNSFAKIHLYNGWKEIASSAQGPIVADEQWVWWVPQLSVLLTVWLLSLNCRGGSGKEETIGQLDAINSPHFASPLPLVTACSCIFCAKMNCRNIRNL